MKKLTIVLFSFILSALLFGFIMIGAHIYQLRVTKNDSNQIDSGGSTALPTPSPRLFNDITISPTPPIQKNGISSKNVTISFGGDVLLDGHVGDLIEQKGASHILEDVKLILLASDVNMVNLENPISERGTKEGDKQYTFKAKPRNLKVLTDGGINIVSLANNHVLDFGTDAFLDTLKHLKASNIRYVGAGEDDTSAYAPVYLDVKGTKLAFIAASHVIPFVSWHAGTKKPGVASTYEPTRVLSEIAKAKSKADIVAVYIHWGEEMNPYPLNYQKNLAKLYIDKGADIVVGSHPHVLQGIEYYKGKIIAYSLGNFIFTNIKRETMILRVEIKDKKLSQAKVIPCEINSYRPMHVKDNMKFKSMIDNLKKISFGVDISYDGIVKLK